MAASAGTGDLGPDASPDNPEEDSYTTKLPLDNAVKYAYQNGIYILTTYGWHIFFGLIVAAIVWTNLKPALQRWWRKRESRMEEANFDPVKAEQYQDGMLLARERMQKELDEKSQEHQAMEDERKAEARDERIKQWEEFRVVTKSKSTMKSKPRRNNFPLDGHGGGGGSSYRPPRRTLGGAGGGGGGGG